ncbi:MAG: glycosyltransferase family 4 protein [Gammaproteobacteria bacterium]|nr:glycosyltransferase family 4 protein [Gammaproteobacteria bacterium]
MKVLELCLSTGIGGLELYAVRTAAQLRSRQIESIAVVGKDTMTAKRMQQHGIPIIEFNTVNRFLPLLSARRLASIIDEQQVDILHMHWARDLNLAVLAKRFAARPVKLIYTRQMMITRSKKDIYHRFLYRHVDLFLTITQQLSELAQQYLPMPADAIRTLYYGVEDPPKLNAQQRTALRQSLQIPDNSYAIGMVGRIEEGKGQHLLVEAIRQLVSQGANVHATIIGPAMNPEYETALKKQVGERQLSGVIRFYGSHHNPIEIMPAFDVVVLATKQETFGLVLIEAMRNGVAVIGTRAGGVPEVIDEGITGLMFKPENAKELTEKLLLLINDRNLCQKLAQAGKEKADRLFAQEQHYHRLINFMEQLKQP